LASEARCSLGTCKRSGELSRISSGVLGILASDAQDTPMMDVPNPESAGVLQRYKDTTRNLWRAKCIGALLLDAKVIAQIHELELSGRLVTDLMNAPSAPAGEDAKRILAMRDQPERFLALVREDVLKP
jgi:hypothetical protein